jgi:hypothetical protein
MSDTMLDLSVTLPAHVGQLPTLNDLHVPPPTPALAMLTVWAAVTIAPRIRASEAWNRISAVLHVACRLPGWVLSEWWARRRR